MTERNPRILVTDGDQRSSLAVVRSLGSAGYRIAVCGTRAKTLAGASRHSEQSFQVPDPRTDPDQYRKTVGRLIRDHRIDLLVPTTDTSISILVDLPTEIPELRLPQSGREAYERLSNKYLLTAAASALGVAVPEQVVIDGPEQVDHSSLDRLGYPIVLKPCRSSVMTSTDDGGHRVIELGVVTASSPGEVEASLRNYPDEAFPILAQKRIVGPGKGVFVLRWKSKTYASFAHRRIREKPPTGGVSVYRESIPVEADLLDQAGRILDHFDWNGVAMVEFKEDRESGTAYLMEVNARFWGSLQLAIDAGIDFPRLLVELATLGRVAPVTSYRTGIRSRWFWGEVDHVIACVRADASIRSDHPDFPSRIPTVLRFLVPWLPGDRYEVLRVGDPRPFLVESVQWVKALGQPVSTA